MTMATIGRRMKKFDMGYFFPAFAGGFASAGFVSAGFPWAFLLRLRARWATRGLRAGGRLPGQPTG